MSDKENIDEVYRFEFSNSRRNTLQATNKSTLNLIPFQTPTVKIKLDISQSGGQKNGKHANVKFGKLSSPIPLLSPWGYKRNEDNNTFFSPSIALKTQFETKTAYHELSICRSLPDFSGFVKLVNWSKDKNNEEMTLYLEKGDLTLFEFVKQYNYKLPTHILKCILFQILFSLWFGQTTCEFMHNDLHLKNILLKKINHTCLFSISTFNESKNNIISDKFIPKESEKSITSSEQSYKGKKSIQIFSDNKCSLNSRDKINKWKTDIFYIAKLADFGSSRITLPNGETLYIHPHSSQFVASSDICKLAQEFKNIRLDENAIDIDKKQYRDLKKQMNKIEIQPQNLLEHPFFKSLIYNGDESNFQSDIIEYGHTITPLRSRNNFKREQLPLSSSLKKFKRRKIEI